MASSTTRNDKVTTTATKTSQQQQQQGNQQATTNRGPQENQNIENQFFYEDEVFYIDKKGHVKFGLVMENFEAASSDMDDNEFSDILRKGEIRVSWHPDGKEEVICEHVVGLADRTLMPGDVVRRLIPGKDTQRGYCRDILVRADVKVLGTKYVIENVAASRLRPLITMPRDNAVFFDSWVGSTKTVNEKLTLKSTCGSLLELRPDIEYCPLKDIGELKSHGGYFIGTSFYPGQILAGPVCALDNAKWITTSNEMRISRKHKTVDRKFVVQSVEIDGVWVHWQCKALSDGNLGNFNPETEIQEPKCYITGDDLKKLRRLNLFESCMLQINDKNYLKIEEKDFIVKKSNWRKDKSNKYSVLYTSQKKMLKEFSKDISKWNVITTTTHSASSGNTDKSCDNKKCILHNSDCDLVNSSVSKSCNSLTINNKILCPVAINNHTTSNTVTGNKGMTRNNETVHIVESKLKVDNSKCLGFEQNNLGWKTDEDDEDESDGNTTPSSCSTNPTPKSSPKRSPLLSKKIKRLKKRSPKPVFAERCLHAGDDVVTEALLVYSTATVVWQDGSIETGIPSTQLYPIHHLDDHEFFPGDFVLAGNEQGDISHRDYGVIQKVDHQGRTALVKWFRTYTCIDDPRPALLRETEVSVYDLKDHPDFQYRPGTIVIRVANFIGEETACTAGQVIDNYPEGKVKVWWVDGHISMCWPQDLFEVGQYDADNNFWGHSESDNDSWETESEISEPGGCIAKSSIDQSISKSHLAINLERARVAMARLEEIFNIKPNLQNQDIMKKLLAVYKKCRYLDQLIGSSFFHEKHFMGLLERVRKGGNATTAERVQDQMYRLFSHQKNLQNAGAEPSTSTAQSNGDTIKSEPKILELSAPKHKKNSTESDDKPAVEGESRRTLQKKLISSILSKASPKIESSESAQINNSDKTEAAPNEQLDAIATNSNVTTSLNNKTDATTTACNFERQSHKKFGSCFNIYMRDEAPEHVCAKLCALIKAQLVIALQEINQRFCEPCSLSEIVLEECDLSADNTTTNSLENNSNVDNKQIVADTPQILDEIESNINTPVSASVPLECFLVLDSAQNTHKFHLTMFQPSNTQQFYKAVRREHKLLKTSLPSGVWVRLYEDRIDLLSVMIQGPQNTPYEDGMFLFDIHLGNEYPLKPPMCHYISYCSDRLNPNLYEDGKVCVSLLGTWSGKGSEIWTPTSSLLQVIVSIQGLILVSEPYFNEAGYEKQKGTQQGNENSRMYNEMVILKLIQSMSKMVVSPPVIFREQVLRHFRERGEQMYERIRHWMKLSEEYEKQEGNTATALASSTTSKENDPSTAPSPNGPPEFPLVPASRGFCLTLSGLLENFHKLLQTIPE